MTVKKKLLVILGAGSSIPVGMPSVPDLDRCMNAWSEDWTAQFGSPNFFTLLRDTISAYYQSGDGRTAPSVNFEKILGEMIALAHWMEPVPWGDTLRATACGGAKPRTIPFPMLTDSDRYGATVPIIDQLSNLLARLAKYMRAKSRNLDASTDAAQQYQLLLNGLRGTFDVGI